MRRMSRREFLRVAGAGAFAIGLDPLRQWTSVTDPSLHAGIQHGDFPLSNQSAFTPDAEISLTANDKSAQILPGAQTRVYTYEGKLLRGSGVTVQAIPGSYLGPILRAKRGARLRIHFRNNLIENTVVHPHGLLIPQVADGLPMQAIGPGKETTIDIPVINRAGPYWFHPHPMMRTAEQVVMGLAGLFYVWDAEEEKAIPGASVGANDVPVVIQDRAFDANNQLAYSPNMMWGYLGDRILVNGKPDAKLDLEPRAYRLRFLNGSNARTYKLAWSNNMPIKVIGTDGGLLSAAVSRSFVMLMPGERVDVWADFSGLAGQNVSLRSLAFTGMGMGMGMMGGMGGMGMMGGGALANGAAFDILTVAVGRKTTDKPVLGPLPPTPARFDAKNVPNFDRPTQFVVGMQHMMKWTINGRAYEEMAYTPEEVVYLDRPVAWEWVNYSPIPHPMHIHNIQFQVISRSQVFASSGYEDITQGLVDSGWKDTVLVWPGERVKVAMKFGPHAGMYMYHCHILEHEDMGMMRNLMVMESGK